MQVRIKGDYMNYEKWCKYIIVFFICLICTSCVNINEVSSIKESEVIKEDSKKVKGKKDSSDDINDETTMVNENSTLVKAIKQQIGQSALLDMCTVSENVVLILIQDGENGKGYFFDIGTKKNIAVIENVPLASEFRVSCYPENIVLLASSGECFVFDEKYVLQEKFNTYNKFYFGMMKSICVLPKSKKLIYSKDVLGEKFLWCMYSVGYTNKDKKRILALEQGAKNLNYVNSCTNVAVSDDETYLFFQGGYCSTVNEQEKYCYGYYDIKSEKIKVYYDERTEKIAAKNMLLAGEEAYFYDGMLEEKDYTGNIYCIGQNGNQTTWKLHDKREGENVILSDKENYIITYYWKDEDTEKRQTIINIYNRKKFERVSTIKINKYLHDVLVFENGVVVGLGMEYKGKKIENVFVQREWKNEK